MNPSLFVSLLSLAMFVFFLLLIRGGPPKK